MRSGFFEAPRYEGDPPLRGLSDRMDPVLSDFPRSGSSEGLKSNSPLWRGDHCIVHTIRNLCRPSRCGQRLDTLYMLGGEG